MDASAPKGALQIELFDVVYLAIVNVTWKRR